MNFSRSISVIFSQKTNKCKLYIAGPYSTTKKAVSPTRGFQRAQQIIGVCMDLGPFCGKSDQHCFALL